MAQDGAERSRKICFDLLPKVSRTFALSIARLKEPLKSSVCVSYLLCRILDTVEDAPGLRAAERWSLMEPLLGALREEGGLPEGWGASVAGRLASLAAPQDLELLGADADVFALFSACGESDRLAMTRWVTEMGKGMVAWSERMGEGEGVLKTLPSLVALDRYCYYIAGTVGYLLTDLYYLHSPFVDRALYFRLQSDAEDFGLGLQKVNIVKDLAEDYGRGWCFIPQEFLQARGVAPADFASDRRADAVYAAVRPVLVSAAGHLRRAWRYLSAFPREEPEIRFFLSTSLFFAIETLALIAKDPSRLTAPEKLKISRLQVAALVASLATAAGDPASLEALYLKLSKPLEVFEA